MKETTILLAIAGAALAWYLWPRSDAAASPSESPGFFGTSSGGGTTVNMGGGQARDYDLVGTVQVHGAF